MKHHPALLKRVLSRTLLILLLFCLPGFSISARAAQPDTLRKRPTVGLVLSGGGAKGFAYIGLLRVIQEVGLPVDYIGGSSIGSIIGGLYAIGYHPDTIAKLIRAQHWDNLLKDITERKYRAYEEKGIGEKTIVRLPLKNKKIGISSMYQGQEIDLLLNRFFSPVYKINDFKKFQTPFLCMGTNLLTGEAVILNKGYLPMAIRASMSIPGYFEPTEYSDYYLVDGGVVNNYPVKEVKEMGAQIIVGGDVQSGLYTRREELGSLPAIIDQITSFSRIRANEIGDSLTDLKVRIKMVYGMMDFDMYDSIMAVGERIARSHYTEIKALADSLNAIAYKPLKKYNASPLTAIRVDSIIIRGNHKMHDSYFNSIFGSLQNRTVSLDELEKDIRLTYGSGYFERVSYQLDYRGEKTFLVIDAVEGGPGELSAGVHFDNDYGISLTLGGAFRNVLGTNSKLFADVNVAINPRIRATYLLGLGGKGSFGASAEFYTFKINTYNKDIKDNKYNLTNYIGSLFFNYNFRNMISLKAGVDYEYFRFKQDITIDSIFLPYETFSSYGYIFISLNADTRDRACFPTTGTKAMLKAEYVMPFSKNWSQDLFSNSAIFSFKFDNNIPVFHGFVLQPGLFAGAIVNNGNPPPIQHLFGLGGLTPDNYVESFVPFTGLHFIQEFGYYSLVGRLKLQYNVFNKLYLNLRADAGGNEMTINELFTGRSFLVGYGVAAGYDSIIGPLELTVMSSNINPGLMVFLNLGYWF
ncbi:MAG: patatin-like phospholipase family protein [Bacteroidetes bacterium]|nr:patatin-like phospholipase family protein [Bacteroidota bacterium]